MLIRSVGNIKLHPSVSDGPKEGQRKWASLGKIEAKSARQKSNLVNSDGTSSNSIRIYR